MKATLAAVFLFSGSLLFGQQQQKTLTTNAGAPVANNQDSLTAGEDGPVLLQDLNQKGKETPVFVRFSTVMPATGSPEQGTRDPRGFATKFYTEEGNYDIVGINQPVFFIRAAIKFPDFVHAMKASPVTNRQDPTRQWDFLSLEKESTNMMTYMFLDSGTPQNYRQMDGWGVHAFRWVNAQGKVVFVKYKWTSMQGYLNTTPRTVDAELVKDPQGATDDLYREVGKGNFPSWELSVQIATPEQLNKLDFDPFDDTKIWT